MGRVTPAAVAIGVLTGALDTLGIDGVATTVVIYRTFGLVEDSRIPGTVLAGFSLPAVVQAVVLTTTFETHFNSLLLLAIAAAVGARLGSHIVSRWQPARRRYGLGVALVVGGLLMFTRAIWASSAGGTELALHGTPLLITLAGFVVIGAFASLGANAYGPGVMISAQQGMNASAAQPIARAAWVVISATAGRQFLRRDQYDSGFAAGLAAGGVVGVLAASRVAAILPAYVLWPVAAAIVITGAGTILSARRRTIEGTIAS
jgi:uncharacterized membrane protein YfcA